MISLIVSLLAINILLTLLVIKLNVSTLLLKSVSFFQPVISCKFFAEGFKWSIITTVAMFAAVALGFFLMVTDLNVPNYSIFQRNRLRFNNICQRKLHPRLVSSLQKSWAPMSLGRFSSCQEHGLLVYHLL